MVFTNSLLSSPPQQAPLLEAIASGTPIISIDHQGAADIVDEKFGFKIPPTNRHDVAEQMCDIIT